MIDDEKFKLKLNLGGIMMMKMKSRNARVDVANLQL